MKKTQEIRKVSLFITAVKSSYQKEFEIKVECFDRSAWNHDSTDVVIPLSSVEVEVPIPTVTDKQLMNEEIEQLKSKIQKEKADSHVRVTAIEEKIQSLLCIENTSE